MRKDRKRRVLTTYSADFLQTVAHRQPGQIESGPVVEIKVWPQVTAVLGASLPRDAMVVALTRLRDQLTNNLARYKPRRDPEDPDLFDYVLYVVDRDSGWHTLRFSVNDCMATDHLIVMAVSHKKGKVRF